MFLSAADPKIQKVIRLQSRPEFLGTLGIYGLTMGHVHGTYRMHLIPYV